MQEPEDCSNYMHVYLHKTTHRVIWNACWRRRGGWNFMLSIDYQLPGRVSKFANSAKVSWKFWKVGALILSNCSSFACSTVDGVGMVVCTCTEYIHTKWIKPSNPLFHHSILVSRLSEGHVERESEQRPKRAWTTQGWQADRYGRQGNCWAQGSESSLIPTGAKSDSLGWKCWGM